MFDKLELEYFILKTIHTFNEFIIKLENDFLPDIHKITSIDEINDFQTVIKEFIIDDIKLIFKEWDILIVNIEPEETNDIFNPEISNTSSDNSIINNNIIDITDFNNDSEENEKNNVPIDEELNDDDDTRITIEENYLIQDKKCEPNHSNNKENEIEKLRKNKENSKINTNDDDDENANIISESQGEECKFSNDNIGSDLESDGILNISNDKNTNNINHKRKRTFKINGINENAHKSNPNNTITQTEERNNTVSNEHNLQDKKCEPNHSNNKENEIEKLRKNKENSKINTNDDDDENTNIISERRGEECKFSNDNIGSDLESGGIVNISNDKNTNNINHKRKRTITIDGINENAHKNYPNNTITQTEETNNTVSNEHNLRYVFNRNEECIVPKRIVTIENKNNNSEDDFNRFLVEHTKEPVYTITEQITVKSIDCHVEDDLESILNENSKNNNSQHSINKDIGNSYTNNQINKSPPPSRKLNSDFVDCSVLKNTNITKTLKNLLTQDPMEKVRQYVEQCDSFETDNISPICDSFETDYISSVSYSIDTDDCLSSISTRYYKNKTKQKYQYEKINEENKENSTPLVNDKKKENNSKNVNSDDTYKENREQVKNVSNQKDFHHDDLMEDDSTDANFDLLNNNKRKEDTLDQRNESEILIFRDKTKKLDDDDDDVRIIEEIPSKKRPSVSCISLDEDDNTDEIKKSSESNKKPIKNGEIKKEVTNKMRTLKKKNELKNNVVDDDDNVQCVCSSFQQRVTNPIVREHLQKLVNNIDEISVINKDNEDEAIDVLSSDDDDDDYVEPVDSLLDEENASNLDLKFRKTARKRRGRSMSLQKRAKKLLPVIIEPSNQDLVSPEDRFQGESPVVLDVDEETGNIVSICHFYSKVLKNHQKRGVQFMWDTCFGNMRKLREENGSGCILAHDMGLGKSLEVIALLHILRKLDEPAVSKILLLCPKSLVQNWEDEVNKWTNGFHTKLPVYSWKSDKNQAVCDLHQWSANGGIYVLVYQMFRSICKKKEMYNVGERDVDWATFFLDPGPDILICDEAHLLKNCRSEIYKSLKHIRTNRRIALTGTPIQNNLEELYNLVKFVQPNFMNKETFRDQFIIPISLGQEAKATREEKNKANERIVVLHKELEKVLDREQGSNHEVGVPPKINYDIILNLTDIQKKIYQYYCSKMKDSFEHTMMFAAVRIAENIAVHPKSLEFSKRVEELKNKIDDSNKGNEWHDDLKGDWWKNVLSPNEIHDLYSLESGVKALMIFKIIEFAAELNDKVLVFCNSLDILNVLQTYLEQHKYEKNVNYFRLDGNVPKVSRIKYVNTFSDEKNTNAKVFLLTHKVGGVGLNFTGANRIVMVDMPWNPSYHEQSSNRTHRIGQKKTSFVYRLITKGTIEEKIYKTTVSKQSLSKRVVDKKKIKALLRERDIFNFDYQEGMTLRKRLPSAKDDLLNYLIQNDENRSIHSYQEQGELFELSEEQSNEAKAYEDYLNESTLTKELGEKKKQRRRKSQIQDEPFVMQQNTSGPYPRYTNPSSQSNYTPYNHTNLKKRKTSSMPPPLMPIPKKQKKSNGNSIQQTNVNIGNSTLDLTNKTFHHQPSQITCNTMSIDQLDYEINGNENQQNRSTNNNSIYKSLSDYLKENSPKNVRKSANC